MDNLLIPSKWENGRFCISVVAESELLTDPVELKIPYEILAGDVDGDKGRVTSLDYTPFISSYGEIVTSPEFAAYDFNLNGDVGVFDNGIIQSAINAGRTSPDNDQWFEDCVN